MILILGALRTGSTLLYQLIVNLWRVHYFDNTGDVHTTDAHEAPYSSTYGKTGEPWEPNEASGVLTRWFGESNRALPGMDAEIVKIVHANAPMVIKNIWNVWRVDEWKRLVPDVQFIWIRRRLYRAARADMLTSNRLNGAFARFVGTELEALQPFTRAMAQQAIINNIINDNLRGVEYIQMYYTDLCMDTEHEIARLREFVRAEYRTDRSIPNLSQRVRHEA
jgi:hypothetical protein